MPADLRYMCRCPDDCQRHQHGTARLIPPAAAPGGDDQAGKVVDVAQLTDASLAYLLGSVIGELSIRARRDHSDDVFFTDRLAELIVAADAFTRALGERA